MIAFAYSAVLTEAGMILNPWYNFLDKHIGRKPWLFKPLVDCFKCVAGQFAFWHYVLRFLKVGSFAGYDLLFHIFTICFTIYITLILNKIYTWTKQI